MFRIEDIAPAELLPALRWLGKSNPHWLRWEKVPLIESPVLSSCLSIKLPDHIPVHLSLATKRGIAKIKSVLANPPTAMTAYELYSLSQVVADGVKVVRPYDYQCEALANVDVTCGFDDYRQPFPAVVAEFPQSFRKKLKDQYGAIGPRYVVCHHDEESQYVNLLSYWSSSENIPLIYNIMSPRHDTIEEALQTVAAGVQSGGDIDASRICERIMLNMMLIMANYGVRSLGPLAVKRQKNVARRRRRGKSLKKSKQNVHHPAITGEFITFSQDVVFYQEQEPSGKTGPTSDDEGTPKRPHWRRGYFRRQPYGEGGRLRKLVFIKPVLVNAHQFKGDKADTHVGYRVHKMKPEFSAGGEKQS